MAGKVSYLAFWRLEAVICSLLSASLAGTPESAWEKIVRVAAPGPAYLYVPAFSLTRPVVQMLGVSLTRAQPVLELSQGARADAGWQPSVVPVPVRLVGGERSAEEPVATGGGYAGPGGEVRDLGGVRDVGEARDVGREAPDYGLFSPVVIGRQEARTLAHFVHLGLEAHEARDLRRVDYELSVKMEDLVFIPAVWDPRYIREANWRLLLKEFDGLVA